MFWLLLSSTLFVQVFSNEICDFDAVLEQYLTNEGFHRNITYEVTFGNYEHNNWYDDCIVGLDQSLPPGVFANSDELEDLLRLEKLSAVLKNRVNIELPAEESQPSNVYILSKLTDSVATMWLPVHARYHAARKNGGYARNEIPPPQLYLRCPDNRLSECEKNAPLPSFLCSDNSPQKCIWKRIQHVLFSFAAFTVRFLLALFWCWKLTSPLVFEVPVGNTMDYHLVASVTAAVVIAGSLYLLKTLHEYKLKRFKKRS